MTGILSFLSTSSQVSSSLQSTFGLIVGCIASINTVLQSVSGSCQFGVKCEAHRTAAEEYHKVITRLRFELEMPNEPDFIDRFIDKLEQDVLSYFPPDRVARGSMI
eukprot:TRINITY_DN6465_c0_g2_i1.p1 TRINITY_DN6465_c0_g2~~TRINITY_DN6465_c0_g2_i1.p1  ORF type:complete len:106 (+),score=15.49 TRINITY_DN6465_c0_g2_i1:370-687(+)